MDGMVTLFTGFNQPAGDRTLLSVLTDIKEGKYRADTMSIRSFLLQGNLEKADQIKRQLPAFTPSATFKGGRKPEYLAAYSGFVHLDFDKLSAEQLASAFHTICQSPYTFACFLSPGGKGLKTFVKVTSGAGDHDTSYKKVQEFYEASVGISTDSKCKDITRLCFVSYDPDCYWNTDSQSFTGNSTGELCSLPVNDGPASSDFQTVFEDCIHFTEQKTQYIQGNRNNFIYLLASNCNRNGIPEAIATELTLVNFDLPESEIRSSVKSAYFHHGFEFSFSRYSANAHQTNTISMEVDHLKNTPKIQDDIISGLPEILRSGASVFTDPRERDVFLTGALAILSGCMLKVSGIYAQEVVYPNLFVFIIAPAASGKGAMKFAKNLADKYHEQLVTQSRENQQIFEHEMNQYKMNHHSKKKDEPEAEPPQQPLFKVLFIPANSSYAKILHHLEQNQGEGIICETEADTMSNVLKQEWGGYSDMLRKSFHHERLSSSKKTNNEFIEVNNSRLSVALSGTPSQVTGLISSSEDGLFSRFLFYAYKVDQVWKDVSPANSTNLTTHFSDLSLRVYDIILFLNEHPTEVNLSGDQWEILNSTCSFWLKETTAFHAEEAGSVVKRLGLILFRIAMVFSALRKYETGETSTIITCNDCDFILAIRLVSVYLQHSLLMFNNLPRQSVMSVFLSGENKMQFFESLPKEFKRAEAIQMGSKYNLSNRSIDALLRRLDGKYLCQPRFGFYRKL